MEIFSELNCGLFKFHDQVLRIEVLFLFELVLRLGTVFVLAVQFNWHQLFQVLPGVEVVKFMFGLWFLQVVAVDLVGWLV